VDIKADVGLKNEILIVVHELEGEGFGSAKVTVEYEWTPPRCGACCVFGHNDDSCPNQVRQVQNTVEEGDGFMEVKGKKTAKRAGIPMKNKPQFEYRPVINKKKDVQEGSMVGSVSRAVTKPGNFGALTSGFLNKTPTGNKNRTGGSPSSSFGKDKSMPVKNSFSVLSNIQDTLPEEKVVESKKGKEKMNRSGIYNCADSDSEVDEVFECDNGFA